MKVYAGGGEGKTPVTTACPKGRWAWNRLRVELGKKRDGLKKKQELSTRMT